MNVIKQRSAIAEACGWKHYHEDLWVPPNVIEFSELECEALPDYLNDLNAMHEAEKVIRKRTDTYFGELIKVRWRDAQPGRHPADLSPAGATAKQRAEAFLRTLNLWSRDG